MSIKSVVTLYDDNNHAVSESGRMPSREWMANFSRSIMIHFLVMACHSSAMEEDRLVNQVEVSGNVNVLSHAVLACILDANDYQYYLQL